MKNLALHIAQTPLANTHDHQKPEADFLANGPDILEDIFDLYLRTDLAVAGADPPSLERLIDRTNPDVAARFTGVRAAWERCKFTGFGQAARWIARECYGIEEITPRALEAAVPANRAMKQPGYRMRIYQEIARLDHIQIDDTQWAPTEEQASSSFLHHDLSWWSFCEGSLDFEAICRETGITVDSLPALRRAMEALFAKFGPASIAVKSQHAYRRPMAWEECPEADAEKILNLILRGEAIEPADKRRLGDWCWARGAELAAQYDLPFKIHTGLLGGAGYCNLHRIRVADLCPLLARFPKTRFVLMHAAFPYQNELLALCKHYPNAYADLCWGFAVDPIGSMNLIRSMIHSTPIHKLFVFGADVHWPNAAAAYAALARRWLTAALQAEIDDGLLSEPEAMDVANRLMRINQRECFHRLQES